MQQRSTYVTVVGWIFIILSSIFLLEALVFVFLPVDKLTAFQAPAQPGAPQSNPALMAAIMHGMGYFLLLMSLWVLSSSIGLIMRKAWARISFIIILGIGIFFDSLYLLFAILGASMLSQVPNQSPGAAAFAHSIVVFMLFLCGGFLALYIWTLVVLNTERVKKEFEPVAKPPAVTT